MKKGKLIRKKIKNQLKSFSKVVYLLTAVILGITAVSYAAVTWDYNPVSSGETLTANTLNELYNNIRYLTDVFEVDSGNVGIGTTSPGAKLHIAGTAGVDGIMFPDNTVQTTAASGGIPSGVIVMWSGTLASIPSGWALCDGTLGTPDLRDKFIYGASAGEDPGATGGATTHSHTYSALPEHSHTATSLSAGSHSHGLRKWAAGGGLQIPTWADDGVGSFVTGVIGLAGVHTHVIIIDNSGSVGCSTDTESSLPPYFKLAFIMKL